MDTFKKNNLTKKELQKIVNFLKNIISIYNELFELLEKNEGWMPLKDEGINSLLELDPPWCTLYEEKDHLKKIAFEECFGKEEVNDELLNNVLEESAALKDQPIDDPQSLEMASFFDILALMIHRRSMCQLISDAKDGDDEAFCLAVQIDRTVLQLPYFQQRLLKSQFTYDVDFLDKLSSRIRTPILQSKIQYRTLTLIFVLLDDMNILFDLPHRKLRDVCEEIGVTGKENGIDDVSTITYQLNKYKKSKMSTK